MSLVHIDKPQTTSSATSASINPWSTMNSPWGKPAVVPVACSLEDVMSEQLADEINFREQSEIMNVILTEQSFPPEPDKRYVTSLLRS